MPNKPSTGLAGAADPYEDYDNLYRKFTEAQRERDELAREL